MFELSAVDRTQIFKRWKTKLDTIKDKISLIEGNGPLSTGFLHTSCCYAEKKIGRLFGDAVGRKNLIWRAIHSCQEEGRQVLWIDCQTNRQTWFEGDLNSIVSLGIDHEKVDYVSHNTIEGCLQEALLYPPLKIRLIIIEGDISNCNSLSTLLPRLTQTLKKSVDTVMLFSNEYWDKPLRFGYEVSVISYVDNTLFAQFPDGYFSAHIPMMEVTCDYCQQPADLVTGRVLYPYREDLYQNNFWRCVPCGAYVGCHKGTNKPLGNLANAQLRKARTATHAIFDSIWKSGECTRSEAYRWLAYELNIPTEKCHIGMFDLDLCRKVQNACIKFDEYEAI